MRQLIDSYKKEVVTSGYKEDMGRKYERKFKDYIGDEYSYTYGDRLYNNDLQNHLTHVVSGPVEKADGAGMTTTDGGAGVITPGMGSYPKRRKKELVGLE